LQTNPEGRLRKANSFIDDNDSIACSLGLGFRFINAKGLPSFVQHSFRFHGLIQDTHVLPAKNKAGFPDKFHVSSHAQVMMLTHKHKWL